MTSPARLLLPVLAPALRVVLYGVLLVLLGEVLISRWPAPDGWAIFGEDGRLEIAQVVLLALSILGAVLLAVRRPETRPLAVLWAGLLLAVLVREHNNHLKDHGFHGLWQMLVAAVFAATLALAWRSRAGFLPSLGRFLASPAFAWMAAGLLVMGFGQLLDELALWTKVLERPDFPYATRRVAEESLEFLAYAFGAIALLEHRLALGRPSPGSRSPRP